MPKLHSINPKKLSKILKKFGFRLDHFTGSHFIFYHPSGLENFLFWHPGDFIFFDFKMAGEEFFNNPDVGLAVAGNF